MGWRNELLYNYGGLIFLIPVVVFIWWFYDTYIVSKIFKYMVYTVVQCTNIKAYDHKEYKENNNYKYKRFITYKKALKYAREERSKNVGKYSYEPFIFDHIKMSKIE